MRGSLSHSPRFARFAVALLALALLQFAATFLHLYWIYPWFDIPMHAFGGLVVALGYLALAERSGLPQRLRGVLATLSVVLLVGVGWELYEFLVEGLMTLNPRTPLGDTILDVVMDLLGGATGYVFGTWRVGDADSRDQSSDQSS